MRLAAMSDFFWLMAFIGFCFVILIVGIGIVVYIFNSISTLIKHKPKSYSEYKELRRKDREIAQENIKKLADYKERVMAICDKNFVSEDEIAELTNYINTNNLSSKQIDIYAHTAFKKHYAAIVSDNLLTDEEMESLTRVAEFLKPDKQLVKKELEELSHSVSLKKIQSGILPEAYTSAIILRRGEIAHFVIPAQLLEERVISRGYKGGSQGVSIRIAKGITYRVGQNRGKLVSEKGTIPVDSGDFVITNRRLIFTGTKKSFSYDYKKLLAWNVYSDGILLNIDNASSRMLSFSNNIDSDAIHLALAYLVDQNT
ncbi:hypothetical protein CPI31_01540 [Moraxella catarrhalis]|nr:hypothetical protein [Moraxella catarrhalis]